jgi:cyclopropane-fatty-acyl-phospholipid synthase
MTAKTCLAIYWQALRLLLKRTPIFAHQAADGSSKSPPGIPRIAAMKSSSLSVKSPQHQRHDRLAAARGVLRQLSQLQTRPVGGDRRRRTPGIRCTGSAPAGEIQILDPAVWGLVAANGSIGAGEAFIHGYWTAGPDRGGAGVRQQPRRARRHGGWPGQAGRPLHPGLHWLNRNTRKGSQKNIAAHYDLGNDLFEEFLDPTMMYSAAQFLSPDDSLEQAQLNKLERICQKLALKPTDHLLEIGTGWGSMALYAAQHTAARSPPRPCPRSNSPTPKNASKPWGCKARSPCCCRTTAT